LLEHAVRLILKSPSVVAELGITMKDDRKPIEFDNQRREWRTPKVIESTVTEDTAAVSPNQHVFTDGKTFCS